MPTEEPVPTHRLAKLRRLVQRIAPEYGDIEAGANVLIAELEVPQEWLEHPAGELIRFGACRMLADTRRRLRDEAKIGDRKEREGSDHRPSQRRTQAELETSYEASNEIARACLRQRLVESMGKEEVASMTDEEVAKAVRLIL